MPDLELLSHVTITPAKAPAGLTLVLHMLLAQVEPFRVGDALMRAPDNQLVLRLDGTALPIPHGWNRILHSFLICFSAGQYI
jgi:hypothetical protein